jgi:GNAT superfamily N-acetyltransferase
MEPEYVVEPLGDTHDRAAFSCGVEPLDRYLWQQAGQDMRRYLAAVYVLHAPGSPTILGYYTLSALSIEPTQLPAALTKRLPRYPVLPAVLVGRLAVDRRWRGRGLGEQLLLSALRRSLRNEIAAWAVVVDAKDDAARRFYEHFGFQRLMDNDFRLFLPMKDVASLFPDDEPSTPSP